LQLSVYTTAFTTAVINSALYLCRSVCVARASRKVCARRQGCHVLSVCCCVMLLCRSVYSQETLDTLDIIADTVQTGEVQHDEFTGSYQRIEQSELSRRDVTLADILSNEAGVQSQQAGGFGTFSSITVRAATAAQTGVYLDGIQLNSGGNAIIDLSLLDLLNVESVDIYRGAAPVQLGAGTIGGAVNVRSPVVTDDAGVTHALLGLGSFNTQRAQFTHRANYADWNFVGALSLQQSDNDYPFLDSNGTPLNLNDDTRQLRNNAGAERISSLIKAGTQWSPDLRTDVLLQGTTRDLGIPEFRNSAANQASFDSDNLRFQINQTWDQIGNWNSRHTLFRHDDRDVFDDSLSQIGLGAQFTETDSQTLGLTSFWEHIGDVRTTSFHVELRNENQLARNLLENALDYEVDRQVVNATAQSVLYFLDDRLVLTPALKLQANNDQYDLIVRLDRSSRSSAVLSPSLGMRFDLSDTLRYRANVGRFFREPSFDELFGSRGLFQGNSDLEAEEGVNVDIGVLWKPASNLSFDVSLFGSLRDELIATVFDSRGVGRTLNVGRARIVGLEFSSNWRIQSNLSLIANLTLQDARSIQEFNAFNGSQLPGEAQQTGYLRLQHKSAKARFFLETSASRERFYDLANVLAAEDYVLHNFGVDWRLGRWNLAGAVNNLSDQNVEDLNGLPRPGRSVTLSFSTTL